MKLHTLLSYQFYNRSDIDERSLHLCLTAKTKSALAETAPLGFPSPWLAHRTLHSMRETQLQMRQRGGAWPQILPQPQSLQRQNRTGVHPTRFRRNRSRVHRQPPYRQNDPQRDLSNQSRIGTAAGKILRRSRARRFLVHPTRFRVHRASQSSSGQHAPGLLASDSSPSHQTGEEQ